MAERAVATFVTVAIVVCLAAWVASQLGSLA